MIPKPGPHTQRARRRKWVEEFKAVCRLVWELRGPNCEGCGTELDFPDDTEEYKWESEEGEPAQFHHHVHRSQGGDNSPENIDLLCLECHTRMHTGK